MTGNLSESYNDRRTRQSGLLYYPTIMSIEETIRTILYPIFISHNKTIKTQTYQTIISNNKNKSLSDKVLSF